MTLPRLGGHIPWSQIETSLKSVLDLGLTPEIAIKGPELDCLNENLVALVARKLAAAQIRPTVHAPFFDLNPGALDPLIRQVTHQRLIQSLSLAGRLNAHLMVIHPGVDKWRYPNLELSWLALAKQFFPPLVAQASACGCCLAIENIYEETPDLLVQLVEGINSPWFGHCFDAGHWQLFGKQSMGVWLDAITPKLYHLHLHDNHGRADEHLPVGEGAIDFAPLTLRLAKMSSLPSMTLEAHSLEHLKRSLHQVKALLK
ncbi:MAG: sugar phosphate isomerase/epimerase family protein [Desulfuromonadales bacterium]|nr:sugar phosphate isomerase/epimerase family protein [Desulfuromonadales bacterium]